MYEVKQEELVDALSEELKGKIKMPDWAKFVKTGIHKQRPPVKDDWWYVRAASILRQVAVRGPIGVSKLRYKYGGRKNRGMAPEHFYKASGKIIRTILQQLEDAKLVKQGQKGVHKGRVLTAQGKSLVFGTSQDLEKGSKPKKPAKKEKSKAEEKEAKEDKKAEKKDTKKSKKKKSSKKESKSDDKKESKEKKDSDKE